MNLGFTALFHALSAAVSRVDIAEYLRILITIYSILILIRIIVNWFPRIPYNRMLHAVLQFVHDVTEPYLGIFRRLIPPLGGSDFKIDLSPVVALMVLYLGGQLLISLIG